jgi:putative transcriptional regulator
MQESKNKIMNLELDLFKIEHNNIIPKQGRCLVAGPLLHDEYFSRSVVLLTEHNEKGTLGFVLNKPLELNLHDLIQDFPPFKARISMGGPVALDRIQVLHKLGSLIPNSVHVFDDIFWGGDFETVKSLISKNQIHSDEILFFLGYSGWEANQLEKEIIEDSWLVTELNPKEIMSFNKKIWNKTLKKLDEKYKIWENFPENPSYN